MCVTLDRNDWSESKVTLKPAPLKQQRERRDMNCVGGHDRGGKPEFTSLLRSDTLMSHQSDPRCRSNLILSRGRNDDINRMNLAARTARGRYDRSSERLGANLRRSVTRRSH